MSSSTAEDRHTIKTQPSPARFSLKTAATLTAVLVAILALFNPPRALFSYLSTLSRRQTTSTTTTTAAAKRTMARTTNDTSTLTITKRPWNARGHADHGWLYTFHTFSFASYRSAAHTSFGPLRVLNEDRVQRGTGFGKHTHAEFAIWSYIVSGELEHEDSMGNLETLRRGEVQFTRAGTGIAHSEFCRNEQQDVHFLQIWAVPRTRGLAPRYCTREFPDEVKRDRLVRVVEAEERHTGKEGPSDPIEICADLSMDAAILGPGKKVVHELVAEGRRDVYVHVVMSGRKQPETGGARVRVGDVELGEGDGAYVRGASGPGEIVVESIGDKPAEFLLFDMGQS